MPGPKLLRERQDPMVGLVPGEDLVYPGGLRLPHLDEETAPAGAQRQPVAQRAVPGEVIELTNELAGLEVDQVITALEAVELLQHDDGERDVVLLEVVDAGVVEEDHVGVDHEELLHSSSLTLAQSGIRTRESRPEGRDARPEKREEGKDASEPILARVTRSRHP
jgi:hypothetical protein